MSHDSPTYSLRKRLPANLLGNALFSAGMIAKVPYFGTVLPLVQEMRPGYCRVVSPNWFGVHNHLGTFHAIAACNLAETAMGMLMEATVPSSHRWIPKAMNVQYLAKGTTRLTAHAELAREAGTADDGSAVPIDFAALGDGADVVVSVRVCDTSGTEVVHADITTWVTPA